MAGAWETRADAPLALAEPNLRERGEGERVDEGRRAFLSLLGLVGLGVAASSMIPKRAEALVMGSTPGTGVVGVRDGANARINPAQREGIAVLKKTTSLSGSGTVHTPASGKKVRIYNTKFSLTADLTSVGFRFTAGGTNYETYVNPKGGGLYGTNNHPNYVEGGVDEVVYCAISGSGTVQVNIDYLEV